MRGGALWLEEEPSKGEGTEKGGRFPVASVLTWSHKMEMEQQLKV